MNLSERYFCFDVAVSVTSAYHLKHNENGQMVDTISNVICYMYNVLMYMYVYPFFRDESHLVPVNYGRPAAVHHRQPDNMLGRLKVTVAQVTP